MRTAKCPRCATAVPIEAGASQVVCPGCKTILKLKTRGPGEPRGTQPPPIPGRPTGPPPLSTHRAGRTAPKPRKKPSVAVWCLVALGALVVLGILSQAIKPGGLGSRTSSMTFEEFRSKLEELHDFGPPVKRACNNCNGTGRVRRTESRWVTCDLCKGTGKGVHPCEWCNGKWVVPDVNCGGLKLCEACKGTGKLLGKCPKCQYQNDNPQQTAETGSGKILKDFEMAEPCDRCGGTGQITYHKQATKEQFWSVMGKPIKKQHVGGTYTRYWYYKCRDGLIQLRVWYVPSTKSFGWNDPSLY